MGVVGWWIRRVVRIDIDQDGPDGGYERVDLGVGRGGCEEVVGAGKRHTTTAREGGARLAHGGKLWWGGGDARFERGLDQGEALRAVGAAAAARAERGRRGGHVGKGGGVACVEDAGDVEFVGANELLQGEDGGEMLGWVGEEEQAGGGVGGEVGF